MAIISLNGLETLKRARQAERDERLLAERNHVAKRAASGLQRQQAWIRKRAMEDLAQAFLTAEQAEARSGATAEKCRGVVNG